MSSRFKEYQKPILPTGTGLTVSVVLFVSIICLAASQIKDTENALTVAAIILLIPALVYPFAMHTGFAEEYLNDDFIRINATDNDFIKFIKKFFGGYWLAIKFPFLKFKDYLFPSKTNPDLNKYKAEQYFNYYFIPALGFTLMLIAIGIAWYFNERVINDANSVGIYYLDPSQRKTYQIIFTLLIISIIFAFIPNKMAEAISNVWNYYIIFFVCSINLLIVTDQLNNSDSHKRNVLWAIFGINLAILLYALYNLIFLSDDSKDYRILITGKLFDKDRININGQLYGVYDAVRLIIEKEDKYFNDKGYFDASKATANGFEAAKPLLQQLDNSPRETFVNQLKRLDNTFVDLYLARASWESTLTQFFKVKADDRNRIVDGFFGSNAFNNITNTDIDFINQAAKEFRQDWFRTRRTNELPDASKIQKLFSVVATTIGGNVALGAVSSSILQDIDLNIGSNIEVLFNRFMFVTLVKEFKDVFRFFKEFNIYDKGSGKTIVDEELEKKDYKVYRKVKNNLSLINKLNTNDSIESFDSNLIQLNRALNPFREEALLPDEIFINNLEKIRKLRDQYRLKTSSFVTGDQNNNRMLNLLELAVTNIINNNSISENINYILRRILSVGNISQEELNTLLTQRDQFRAQNNIAQQKIAEIEDFYTNNQLTEEAQIIYDTYEEIKQNYQNLNNQYNILFNLFSNRALGNIGDINQRVEQVLQNAVDFNNNINTLDRRYNREIFRFKTKDDRPNLLKNIISEYNNSLKNIKNFVDKKTKELSNESLFLSSTSSLIFGKEAIGNIVPFFSLNEDFYPTSTMDLNTIQDDFVYNWDNDTPQEKLTIPKDKAVIYKKFFDKVKISKNDKYINLTAKQKNTIAATESFQRIYGFYFDKKKPENGSAVDLLFNKFESIFTAYTKAIRSYLISSNNTERELAKNITLKLKNEIYLINEGFPTELENKFYLYGRDGLFNQIEIGRIEAAESEESYNDKFQRISSLRQSAALAAKDIRETTQESTNLRLQLERQKTIIFNNIVNALTKGGFSPVDIKFNNNNLVRINFLDKKELAVDTIDKVKNSFSGMVRIMLNSLDYLKSKINNLSEYGTFLNSKEYGPFITALISTLFVATYGDINAGISNGIDRKLAVPIIANEADSNNDTFPITRTDTLFRDSSGNALSASAELKNSTQFFSDLGKNINLNKNNYNQDVEEFFENTLVSINDRLANIISNLNNSNIVKPDSRREYLNKIINRNNNNINFYMLARIFNDKNRITNANLEDIFEGNYNYKKIVEDLSKPLDSNMKDFLISTLEYDYNLLMQDEENKIDPVETIRSAIVNNPFINCLNIIS